MDGLPDYDTATKAVSLTQIIQQYEISAFFSDKLKKLENFDTALLLDDSGSMTTLIKYNLTRWNELQHFVKIFADITTHIKESIDVNFLNRRSLGKINSFQQIEPSFINPPSGYTPILDRLQTIINRHNGEQNLLVVIVTDGLPTDTNGLCQRNKFKKMLLQRNKNVYITICACTDDDDVMSYLNRLDRTVFNLDVIDDYISERKEVKKAQGANFHFSYGDYISKCLLGTIDKEIDALDERHCVIL